jgi:hypothetical protein
MDRPMPAVAAAAARAHATALWLYPPGFRREFAPQMACDFEEASSEAWLAGSRRALAVLWLRVSIDLARSIVVQWTRTGMPALLLISPLPACAVFACAASGVGYVRPFVIPPTTADREALELLLAATVVILLLAASITITTWLTGPLLHRRR